MGNLTSKNMIPQRIFLNLSTVFFENTGTYKHGVLAPFGSATIRSRQQAPTGTFSGDPGPETHTGLTKDPLANNHYLLYIRVYWQSIVQGQIYYYF